MTKPHTDTTILHILDMRARGLTCAQIAAKTGITRNAVAGVLWRADRRAG